MKIEEKVEVLKEYYKDLNIESISSRGHNYWTIHSYYYISKSKLLGIKADSFKELIDTAYNNLKKEVK